MLGLLGTRITRRRHRLTGLQGMHALLEQLHHGQPIAVLLLVVQESPESLGGQRADAVRQGAAGQVVVVRDRELSAVRHSAVYLSRRSSKPGVTLRSETELPR